MWGFWMNEFKMNDLLFLIGHGFCIDTARGA